MCPAVSGKAVKVLTSLAAVVLLAAACSTSGAPAELVVAKGEQFVPQVVEFSSNVGSSPSIALDSEGSPVLTYLGFKSNLEKGEIPEVRSIIAPPLPNVLFANLQDGYWNLGGVAAQNTGSGVQAGDDDLVDPAEEDVNGVPKPWPLAASDLALDQTGNMHVAWTERGQVSYATDATGNFKEIKVADGDAWAPSIAVAPSGDIWIAYMRGRSVELAFFSPQKGGRWETQVIADAPDCGSACPATATAIEAGRLGPVVAYTGARGPEFATSDGGVWSTTAIAPGSDGFGISLALDKSDFAHVAYYDGGANVYVADNSAGRWASQKISTSPGGIQATADWSTGLAIDESGARYVAYTEPAQNTVRLAREEDGQFVALNTPGTDAGSQPSVAVTQDGSVIYLAWYNTQNENLQVGTFSDVTQAPSLAVVSPSPVNSNAAPPPATGCEPGGSTVKLDAPAGAATSGFDTDCIAAVADKPFKIAFVNDDSSIHNVAITVSGPASPDSKFIFENTAGVDPGGSDTYSIDGQKPGDYFFYCYFHPATMTGTLVVK